MPTDHYLKIKDLLHHSRSAPMESKSPILHFQRSSADIWTTLEYFQRVVDQGNRYQAVVDRHMDRLRGMSLINLVESFERFLKEAAALCVDFLADFTVDDRFNDFNIKGNILVSHFQEGTIGKALCESSTWLESEDVNKRFRSLLKADGWSLEGGNKSFELFPKQPDAEKKRLKTMNLLWQIRHTSVHNVGLITRSDAFKLGVLAEEKIEPLRIIAPTWKDIYFVKEFLTETATRCNKNIGERLAKLFSAIYDSSPQLLNPQETADQLAEFFRLPLTVKTATGIMPPD